MARSSLPFAHDDLVQRIYDAADEPEGLMRLLTSLRDQLRADCTQTLVISRGVELVDHAYAGADERDFAPYFEHWRDKDPRFAAAMVRPGRVLSDAIDVDRAAFEKSAIYNEFLKPVGSLYGAFGNFAMGGDLVVGQIFLRGAARGAYETFELDEMERIMPHLRRMLRVRHMVRTMQSELDDLRRALDILPTAVAVLERSGKVVCANAQAEKLLREPGGLRTENGRIAASRAAETRELARVIAEAASMADATSSKPIAAAAPSVAATVSRASGAPLAVVLFPLRPRSAIREAAARSVRVLALFHDPDRRIRLQPALVAAMHGLTATEAALACALAEGHTLADFAEARGCSEQTARTHLKRVLDKTGTSRQADLVRVLLTGAAMHAVA